MPPTVEYCLSSCTTGLRSLRDESGVDVRQRRCLEHCGVCRRRPFVVVDGDLVVAPELSSISAAASDAAGEGPK